MQLFILRWSCYYHFYHYYYSRLTREPIEGAEEILNQCRRWGGLRRGVREIGAWCWAWVWWGAWWWAWVGGSGVNWPVMGRTGCLNDLSHSSNHWKVLWISSSPLCHLPTINNNINTFILSLHTPTLFIPDQNSPLTPAGCSKPRFWRRPRTIWNWHHR